MAVPVPHYAKSDIGRRRPHNEDCFAADASLGLYVVCDGMGGGNAGEVASQMAIETILAHLRSATSETGTDKAAPDDPNLSCATNQLTHAIRAANAKVFRASWEQPKYAGMGTTVAAARLSGRMLSVAHVGDSRVYRLEEGRFSRETIDHTDHDDDLRAGAGGGARAGGNVINRALGVESEVDVEIKSIQVRDGVRFLLCSDGIYRHLSDEEMARVLAQFKDPQQAADELKRVVHERGADDNLTAVVVQVGRARQGAVLAIEDPFSSSRPAPRRKAQVAEARGGAGRGNRIEVDFGKPSRRPAGYDDRPLERRAAMDAAPAIDRGRKSNWLIWSLVVLLLVGGAFYGGLRWSDWRKKPPSDQAQPNDPMKAGRAAFDQGNYAAAAAQFTAAAERDAQNADASYWLGRAQLETGEYAKAAASFETAAARRATFFDAYTQAAQAYELTGERAKATQMLLRGAEERRKAAALPRVENANAPR